MGMLVTPGATIVESHVEEAMLAWLGELGYEVAYGPDVEPEKLAAERDDFTEVVLSRRLRAALKRVNPELPASAIGDALKKVLVAESPSLLENNRRFHRLLVDGIDVEYARPDGSISGDKAWLVDFDDPEANDWLAINQFTVVEGKTNRRPDVVVFVNGLPLGVIELKNPGDAKATTRQAFNQLQTYKQQIPSLFTTNELLVASDGIEARHGTLTGAWERFMPWRTVDGSAIAEKGTPELATLVRGIFERRRFLDIVRHFIVFEVDGPKVTKIMAAYHQYWA
jgi:type I restriction enzyme R subunit